MDQLRNGVDAPEQRILEKIDFWNPFKEAGDMYELSLPILKDRDGRFLVQVRGEFLEIQADGYYFFSMPNDSDRNRIHANYTNGHLQIRIHRLLKEQTHFVPVFDLAYENHESENPLCFIYEPQQLTAAAH